MCMIDSVEQIDRTLDDIIFDSETLIPTLSKMWQNGLAMAVAEVNHCHMFVAMEQGNAMQRAVFVGRHLDVEVSKSVFEFLRQEIKRLSLKEVKDKSKVAEMIFIRDNFSLGASVAVAFRLREEVRNQILKIGEGLRDVASSRGMDIVHVSSAIEKLDSLLDRIKNEINSRYPDLEDADYDMDDKAKEDGFLRGYMAGQVMPLHRFQLEAPNKLEDK